MINNLLNKLSYRKGFILGIFTLVSFNILFIIFYFTFFLNINMNKAYNNTKEELTKYSNTLKEELKYNKEYDSYIKEFIKNKDININIYNQNNELVNSYKETEEKNVNISIFNNIKIEDENYLIEISKNSDKINKTVALDFFIFEIINIFILALVGYYISNDRVIKPLTDLSKDFENFKLGIKPKKKQIKSSIGDIQNIFVDLVDTLDESKQKQNTIIASISHDIKTPLTSILGYSERLSTSRLTEEQKNKYINTIHDKAITLKEITEEFDSYLNANIKDESKIEKISIKTLINYLNNYYKDDLAEKNIEFKIKSNCKQSYIKVDLSKFKRVFANVITNSIRYLNKDKKIIIITINEEKNGKIVFEIADNGSGTKENLNNIFEPLYTTDKSRKISGLGLSIVKEIILSHDGTIKAENNKMGGFSIIFTIDSYKED